MFYSGRLLINYYFFRVLIFEAEERRPAEPLLGCRNVHGAIPSRSADCALVILVSLTHTY